MLHGADWIINDSEDEGFGSSGFFPEPHPAQAQVHSSISEFTSRDIVPTASIPSSVSLFTVDKSQKNANSSTTNSIYLASVPGLASPAPAKPKRPRPRPAYKGPSADDDSVDQNTSVAAVTANAINHNAQPTLQPFYDLSFSQDIAERAKTRRRCKAAVGGALADKSRCSLPLGKQKRPSSAAKETLGTMVIELSSDDEHSRASPSFSGRTTEPTMSDTLNCSRLFREPELPHAGDASILPLFVPPSSMVPTTRPPSPVFDRNRTIAEGTPPSLPAVVRKKRRRVIDDDDNFSVDSMGVDFPAADSSVSANKRGKRNPKNQKKDRKPREKKGKDKADAVTASATAEDQAPVVRRRCPKDKDEKAGSEYKSREFVDNSSEDDIAFLPRSSKSVLHSSNSDPASTVVSVLPSADESVQSSSHLLQPESMRASGSVLPAPIFVPPSADLTAPPPSPFIVIPRFSKPNKSKKNRAEGATGSSGGAMDGAHGDARNFASGPSNVPETSDAVLIELARDKDKKDKKGKNKASAVPASPEEEIDVQANLDGAQITEQNVPSLEKRQSKAKRSHRKKAPVLSSDEDEPLEDPKSAISRESEKANESHNENKENGASSSEVRSQPPSMSLPSASMSASTPVLHPHNRISKPHTPSHLPLRKGSMSALIRRVSSKVNSPLASPAAGYVHSPLSKASRAALSRIAPLHPNRRTPPPALPRPPPPKKSKKMLELEEKWEMELAESIEGWACMPDDERAGLRRAKRDAELGYDD